LFPNPSLVTPNVREAYFTDGQRGMQVENDDLSLEYINPIGSNYDRIPAAELIDRSVNHINEQHGWTNNFNLTSMHKVTNKIRYRMTSEGYPLSDNHHKSVIEQESRDQELYHYVRTIVEAANVITNEDTELISGEKLIKLI